MPKIRKEELLDTVIIGVVTLAAFREAAHSGHTEYFIVRSLRDAGQLSLSLVAEDDGSIIGQESMGSDTID